MTARERWRSAALRRGTDRLPTDYWGTPEMTAKLMAAIGCSDEASLWRELGVDRSHHVWASLKDPRAEERRGADVWGVRHREVRYAGGAGTYSEVAYSPLASLETAAELERYPWPQPEWWSFEDIPRLCREFADWPIFGGSSEPFLLYSCMRGLERAMEDLAEKLEFVEAALERIFHIHHAVIEGILRAGGGEIDFVYIAEDLGSQHSLLFSPRVFRKLLKPRMRRMAELAHRYGARVFHHDDGAIRPIIPDLLDAGIDVLNPVQWRCPGMDRRELKREFGARLVFHGGMDNQQTLPFGSPDEVREQVRENTGILGAGGGYVLAPCHNLQPITPVENVLAMYEEAGKLK